MSTLVRILRQPSRVDVMLRLAALVIMLATGIARDDWHRWGWLIVLGILVTWVPLNVIHRYPFPVLVWVTASEAVHIALVAHTHSRAATIPAATMLALYTVATLRPARVAWPAALACGLVHFAAAAVFFFRFGPDLLFLNWALVSTALGLLLQERHSRIAAAERRAEEAERSKQIEAARQVTAERMRIARELHDVLAHHITVVNAQAGVAQYLLRTDAVAAESALGNIAANSRAALDELRATLGLLRTDDDEAGDPRSPAPTIDDLGRLVDIYRGAGTSVEVQVEGARRPLSSAAELAFYRVVQEALTNATKHAAGSPVHIDVNWSASSVQVTVTNAAAGNGASALPTSGTGHGLIGMRERAAAAEGSLDAGSTPDGGYRVRLTVPVRAGDARGAVPVNTTVTT